MTFTQELADATRTIRHQIHIMPFNRKLADGTLPAGIFRGYIVQDAHYLEGFARALSMVAAKAPDPQGIAQLAGSAAGAISAERTLHAQYMDLYGITAAQFEATSVSAACDHYVSFLLRVAALGDFAEGIAALLPCFWIYRDVGRDIAARADAANPYGAWIATYSSEAFDQGVERMLALVDRIGARSDEACRARMHLAYAKGCWHEWHFWDSAYDQRQWPHPKEATLKYSRAHPTLTA